jgi:hypothetical protein
MARTAEGTALTEFYRGQMSALRATVIKEVWQLFPAWNPAEAGSYKAMEDALVLLTQARAARAAQLASRYYSLFRLIEGGEKAAYVAKLFPVAAEAIIRTAIGASARGGTYKALTSGKTMEQALRNGLVRTIGAVTKQVSDTGRYTLIEAVQNDQRALGWTRVTGGNPCAWCAMLASRGPVYKGDADSIEIWDHDHGDCSAEPAYEGYEWPAKNRELRDLWNQTSHDKDTTPLNAFRRALSGGDETE